MSKKESGQIVVIPNKEQRAVIFGLSKVAKDILLHTVFSMRPNSQEVTIDKSLYLSESKVKSAKTYYLGLKELQKSGILIKENGCIHKINNQYYKCYIDKEVPKGEMGLVIGNYILKT